MFQNLMAANRFSAAFTDLIVKKVRSANNKFYFIFLSMLLVFLIASMVKLLKNQNDIKRYTLRSLVLISFPFLAPFG